MNRQMRDETRIPVSFTFEELSRLKSNVLSGACFASRVSLSLIYKLLEFPADGVSIIREIQAMEGVAPPTQTIAAAPFKRPPLLPFWHKHFFTARNLARNIGDRWDIFGRRKSTDLEDMISNVAKMSGSNLEKWQQEVAQRFVDGIFDRANNRGLTGDWIIFARQYEKNYYLDVATHEQGRSDSAHVLAKRLREMCSAEFSLLV
jgi:hypothetical protein